MRSEPPWRSGCVSFESVPARESAVSIEEQTEVASQSPDAYSGEGNQITAPLRQGASRESASAGVSALPERTR
jgi:hypothetical protein